VDGKEIPEMVVRSTLGRSLGGLHLGKKVKKPIGWHSVLVSMFPVLMLLLGFVTDYRK
jgi:hypothetical protein